jgi:pre-mRNA cleavage complex 2 protein Pcf11
MLLDSGAVSPAERLQIMDQMNEMNPAPPVTVPPPALGLSANNLPPFAPTLQAGRSPLPHAAIPTPPPAPAIPGMDIGNILNSLSKLKSTGFTGSPRIGTPDSLTNELPAVEIVQPRDSLEAYEELILGMNVQLSLADMNKWVNLESSERMLMCSRSQYTLPFAHLPKRCAICAARFPDGQAGATALSEHMDWHYRRNNQQNQNSGRGGYRRWLPKADVSHHHCRRTTLTTQDWINDLTSSYSHNAEAGPSTLNPNTTAGRAAAKALADQQRAENMKKRVKIPESQAGKDVLCPICKDKLEKEWSNEAEGFVWINAVKGSGQVRLLHPGAKYTLTTRSCTRLALQRLELLSQHDNLMTKRAGRATRQLRTVGNRRLSRCPY